MSNSSRAGVFLVIWSWGAIAIPGQSQSKVPLEKGRSVMDLQTAIARAKSAAASQNQFGLDLVVLESAAHPRANVFVSPLSLYLALTMTEAGAAGKTLEAMRAALRISPSTTETDLHESASALMQALRSQKGIELSIANAIWSDPSMPLAKTFIDHCQSFYQADARTLEFAKPGAADVVNGWVKEKTKGKIPSIVTPQIVASSRALLTNAVYFMGKWQTEFSEALTADADFRLAGGTTKQVRMMHQPKLTGAYLQGDGWEAAALPYKASGISMYAILPTASSTPEQALPKATTNQLRDGFEPFDLDLKLPRFTLDYGTELKVPLSKLGMGIAFQYPGAQFQPLGSPQFYIGQVLHKTRLEMDEKGTVAAAATAVAVMVGSAMPRKQETKVLVFDRPFALVIADSVTGAVLFAGVVYEP